MNSTIDVILSRRSCKSYSDRVVDDNLVDEIIRCGTMAPSALNRQSASIVYLKNKDLVEKLRNNLIEFVGRDPFYGAKTIILVIANKQSRFNLQDGSCVLENMFIAATSLDVSSCWINCLHDYFATGEGNKFKKEILKLDDDVITVGTCVLGYPETNVYPNKPRKADYVRVID